ncbi:hypothetical protein VNI00_013145 [Paramarasmius palmivorus]|uniref:Copper transporter n=1 Tax=Paramarasmius palmivorus TaxID=297713 RepID=A0AAW0C049_9AGAR
MTHNYITANWETWKWNATSIGTLSTLGGIFVVGFIFLYIDQRRQHRRRAQRAAELDDEEAQMKHVYERARPSASITAPQPAYLSPYRLAEDAAQHPVFAAVKI